MKTINKAAVRTLKRVLRPYDIGEDMDPYPEFTGVAWDKMRAKAIEQVATRYGMDPDALWGDLYATAGESHEH